MGCQRGERRLHRTPVTESVDGRAAHADAMVAAALRPELLLLLRALLEALTTGLLTASLL